MPYNYKATRQFWRSFGKLTPSQQSSAKKAWLIFKSDLRVVFYMDGVDCISVDIGTHAIYR